MVFFDLSIRSETLQAIERSRELLARADAELQKLPRKAAIDQMTAYDPFTRYQARSCNQYIYYSSPNAIFLVLLPGLCFLFGYSIIFCLYHFPKGSHSWTFAIWRHYA